MITDEMLGAYGFLKIDDMLWTSRDWENTYIEPSNVPGRYLAKCGSQQRYVSNEAQLKFFMEVVFLIANQK